MAPDTVKYERWKDGFTAAVDLLATKHDIRLLNIHPDADSQSDAMCELADSSWRDVLLVKSNWSWIVDSVVRDVVARNAGPTVLLVSGVSRPPSASVMSYYDVLVYETAWYSRFVSAHPRTIHGFGVDTSIMCPSGGVQRDIDWLSVGQIVPYKRHEVLADLPGNRLVVGRSSTSDPTIVERLMSSGVQVLPFMSYEGLAVMYRRARNVVVNCTLTGGGERAVLEARACGASVHVSLDNAKLVDLTAGPVFDECYYARRLNEATELAVNSDRKPAIGSAALARSNVAHRWALLGASLRPAELVDPTS